MLLTVLPIFSDRKIGFALSFAVLFGLPPAIAEVNAAEIFHPHQTVTIDFIGPATSESDEINPFTDIRLEVEFRCDHPGGNVSMRIPGFYAADGNAAETSADSGPFWKCRFAAPVAGTWHYTASLRTGPDIAISDDPAAGRALPLDDNQGQLTVTDWPANQVTEDFRTRGTLTTQNGYYRLSKTDELWIKAGTNSPENLLAYEGFDGTERMTATSRKGEAKTGNQIHRFDPHAGDWRDGDPTWGGGRGPSIIGAINYLADAGVNSVYFLTMNIGGDGRDVWPYVSPDDLTRFDCSKLDQWEVLFEHMQRRGLALHVITQETENERLIDDGDTGRLRKLYYRELIARFAHHPALVWNVGEENGPANFTPNAQTMQQQIAMGDYLQSHDPYGHPVLIHSHAADDPQDGVLMPLLGKSAYDGVSMQVGSPGKVHERIAKFTRLSQESGHPWVITMDEIGPAGRGAAPDAVDPNHDEMRGPVLWGSLLAGAAGVEWYFGYQLDHNDLNAEDFRSRAELWRQTKIATDFLRSLPVNQMIPSDDLIRGAKGYCLAETGRRYVVYRAAGQGRASLQLNVGDQTNHTIQWFDPTKPMSPKAAAAPLPGSNWVDLSPPSNPDRDWVAVVQL